MFDSHAGLRDLYEVSSEELDLLVDIADTIEGVYGSRMMGGGFGGCTISLVHKDTVDYFSSEIKKEYREKTGNSLPVYRAAISDGTDRKSTRLNSSHVANSYAGCCLKKKRSTTV